MIKQIFSLKIANLSGKFMYLYNPLVYLIIQFLTSIVYNSLIVYDFEKLNKQYQT